jgi:hypothetical protein
LGHIVYRIACSRFGKEKVDKYKWPFYAGGFHRIWIGNRYVNHPNDRVKGYVDASILSFVHATPSIAVFAKRCKPIAVLLKLARSKVPYKLSAHIGVRLKYLNLL